MTEIAYVIHDGTAETVRITGRTRAPSRTCDVIEYETRDGRTGSTTTTYADMTIAREVATELAEDWG